MTLNYNHLSAYYSTFHVLTNCVFVQNLFSLCKICSDDPVTSNNILYPWQFGFPSTSVFMFVYRSWSEEWSILLFILSPLLFIFIFWNEKVEQYSTELNHRKDLACFVRVRCQASYIENHKTLFTISFHYPCGVLQLLVR